MFLQEKMPDFNHLAEFLKTHCLKLLASNYGTKGCRIGNNSHKHPPKREVFFEVRTSASDDERIRIVQQHKKHEGPYKIVINTNGNCDSNFEIFLFLNEMELTLPKKMIDELYNEFYNYIEVSDD